MKRILFCLCALSALMVAGCGEKLTESEATAPPPAGPRGDYKAPPPGAVGGNGGVRGPRGGTPNGAPGGAAPMR